MRNYISDLATNFAPQLRVSVSDLSQIIWYLSLLAFRFSYLSFGSLFCDAEASFIILILKEPENITK
jgi:hypothetical protein